MYVQMTALSFVSMMSVLMTFNLLSFEELMSKWYVFDCYSSVFIWSMLWVAISLFILPSKLSKVGLILSILFSFMFYSSSHLIWFFVWFEVSMIPMFFVVLNTGVGAERLSASRFLFAYTLLGSVPLLVSSVSLWLDYSATPYIWEMSALMKSNLSFTLHGASWIAFLVKMPLYLVHNWLLKAHVEAPLQGSMFLAGVLLKFGAYGMVRFVMIMKHLSSIFTNLLVSISIWGGTYAALCALISFDSKQSVAYASVSHMNLSISMFFTFSNLSVESLIATMVAHSYSAVLLFFLVTRVYESMGSRSSLLLKGSKSHSSVWGFLGILAWSANLGIPPFLGFIGELLAFLIISSYFPALGLILAVYFMFSTAYSMIIYGCIYNTLPSFKKYSHPPSMEELLQSFTCTMHLLILFWNINVLW